MAVPHCETKENDLDLASELARQKEYSEKVGALLAERFPETPPLACIHSFGCQQNVSDGEKIKGLLAEMGYGFTDLPEQAKLIIYNTCAVRGHAEDRVFGNVGELKSLKAQDPELIIGLCGCMVQQKHIIEKLHKSYPYVNLIFGTHVFHRLPELLYHALATHKRVVDVSEDVREIVEDMPVLREKGVQAWLPIMYGCDNFCSYCVVPYVRGRERSREPEAVLAEAREIIAAGYKEITLLGQNVNSYGKGLKEPITFAKLLQLLNDLEGDFRIRFMTSHPKDCSDELIETIARCPKVCNHIHLPVQHGSDRILKLMNRKYTADAYRALIAKAREKIPGVSFTSDIIVGFPGETYADFQETLALVKEIGYTSLYTFLYSPRVGTKAASFEDPIPKEEKSKWFRELLAVQDEMGSDYLKQFAGKELRVLATGKGKNEGMLTGRSEENLVVDFPGSEEQVGTFVDVRVTKVLYRALVGELIQNGQTNANSVSPNGRALQIEK